MRSLIVLAAGLSFLVACGDKEEDTAVEEEVEETTEEDTALEEAEETDPEEGTSSEEETETEEGEE